jgi:hypothetical protein
MSDQREQLVESVLAGSVRSYIQAQVESEEQGRALYGVCSALEHLLDILLQGSSEWNGWVDGLYLAWDAVPNAVQIVSPVELTVRGKADWGKRDPCWIEPFFAAVRISETSEAIESYEIKFADAAKGLGRTAYGKHIRQPEWYFPEEWLFTFSKGKTLGLIPPDIANS